MLSILYSITTHFYNKISTTKINKWGRVRDESDVIIDHFYRVLCSAALECTQCALHVVGGCWVGVCVCVSVCVCMFVRACVCVCSVV